jgi:hypothetical protein
MNTGAQQRAYTQGIEGPMGMDQGNLARAVLAVMKSVQYVEKRGVNTFHGYNYATEADVVAAIRKGMIDNDLVLLPRMHFATTAENGAIVDEYGITHLSVEYTLIHTVSGERAVVSAVGSGSDKNRNGVGDKGTYKAITGAHKYALMKLFLIETGDDPERQDEVYDDRKDDKRAGPPPVPPKTPPREDEIDDDIAVDDPRDDEPRDDPREDDRDDGDDARDAAVDLPEMRDLSPTMIKRVVSGMQDKRTPILRVPAMGDEEGHPWGIVEEIFKQFVTMRDDYDSLRQWYTDHKRLLSIMEREAPERFKRVNGYFGVQKKTLRYRDEDTRDTRDTRKDND